MLSLPHARPSKDQRRGKSLSNGIVAASVRSDKPCEGERSMQLLVTGATGKAGVNSHRAAALGPRWRLARVRALCHSRTIPETDRIEVVKGSIEDRDCVDRAMREVTHIVHLATCNPSQRMMGREPQQPSWRFACDRWRQAKSRYGATSRSRAVGIPAGRSPR